MMSFLVPIHRLITGQGVQPRTFKDYLGAYFTRIDDTLSAPLYYFYNHADRFLKSIEHHVPSTFLIVTLTSLLGLSAFLTADVLFPRMREFRDDVVRMAKDLVGRVSGGRRGRGGRGLTRSRSGSNLSRQGSRGGATGDDDGEDERSSRGSRRGSGGRAASRGGRGRSVARR